MYSLLSHDLQMHVLPDVVGIRSICFIRRALWLFWAAGRNSRELEFYDNQPWLSTMFLIASSFLGNIYTMRFLGGWRHEFCQDFLTQRIFSWAMEISPLVHFAYLGYYPYTKYFKNSLEISMLLHWKYK